MKTEYDIAIAGGGLAGASLACCLAQANIRVAVLEQHPLDTAQQPSYDDRGIALSLSSCRILNAIGVWSQLADKAVAIRHVHVSDRGRFGFVRLHASDLNLDALGYVVIAREIGRALLQKLSTLSNIDYLCPQTLSGIQIDKDTIRIKLDATSSPPLSCKLLVAADGSSSFIREKLSIKTLTKDYQQTAIVSNITMDKDHANTAYERFTSAGPLALLPMSDSRFVSVFCVAAHDQDHFMRMQESEYLQTLQQVLSKRPGRIIKIGKRQSYPLSLIQAQNQTAERTVLLGNAAHTIHPNGAQGFNLGLRDAASLAEMLCKHLRQDHDPGSSHVLRDYVEFRRQDQSRVIDFTDMLAMLFCNDNPLKVACRNVGLTILDTVPAIKNTFTSQAMGFDGKQPGLVRGLSLDQL